MLALLSLIPFAATALALPTTSTPPDEQWTISRLDLNFMTDNDGLPGGGWPASEPHFDSRISFDIDLPAGVATCQTTFANGTLPVNVIPCTSSPSDEALSFGMTPYKGPGAGDRPELAFNLNLFSSTGLFGMTPITDDYTWSNDRPLFCDDYAPLTGTTCNLHHNITITASYD